MDRELCFIINNTNLFLEKILVSFNEFPILFICFDQQNRYYLVLNTDMERMEYIVINITLQDIYNMLIQRNSIQKTFLNQDCFWKVVSDMDIKNDKVTHLPINEIDLECLPHPDIYYEAESTVDIDYIKEIETKI